MHLSLFSKLVLLKLTCIDFNQQIISSHHYQILLSTAWPISYWPSFPLIKTSLNDSLASSLISQRTTQIRNNRDFPGGPMVKNPPANAGDMDLSPHLGRSHRPQRN